MTQSFSQLQDSVSECEWTVDMTRLSLSPVFTTKMKTRNHEFDG